MGIFNARHTGFHWIGRQVWRALKALYCNVMKAAGYGSPLWNRRKLKRWILNCPGSGQFSIEFPYQEITTARTLEFSGVSNQCLGEYVEPSVISFSFKSDYERECTGFVHTLMNFISHACGKSRVATIDLRSRIDQWVYSVSLWKILFMYNFCTSYQPRFVWYQRC